MKKFITGVIVGAAVATTGSVFASDAVSGTFAEFKILVNGNQAKLADKPVVIDGSSYLPVRAISNSLGYEVQYEDSSKTISLSNDGKKYLKDEKQSPKPEEKKQMSEGNYVKDLKSKYSKDDKLNADLIKAAIEKKEITVDAQDETTGDSLFILAIRENNFPAYQVLKDNGVNPELPNKEGKTPLHIATIVKNSFFMGELKTHFNVKAKIKDNDGKMPIDYTEKNSGEYQSLLPYSL